MELKPGTTYKVSHRYCPNCVAFATCLGEQSHMSIYNTNEQYYRNTKDLERVFEKNNFEITEIQI